MWTSTGKSENERRSQMGVPRHCTYVIYHTACVPALRIELLIVHLSFWLLASPVEDESRLNNGHKSIHRGHRYHRRLNVSFICPRSIVHPVCSIVRKYIPITSHQLNKYWNTMAIDIPILPIPLSKDTKYCQYPFPITRHNIPPM